MIEPSDRILESTPARALKFLGAVSKGLRNVRKGLGARVSGPPIHSGLPERLPSSRIRCTDPVLSETRGHPHSGRRWTQGSQRDGGGCSGGGTVSLPKGAASSAGSRRARVAAQYLGASSRWRSLGQ